MALNDCLECNLPCKDVNKDFTVPKARVQAGKVRLAIVSEAPAIDKTQYYYGELRGSFFQNTRRCFKEAGYLIDSYRDLSRMGIYLTTAIKCSKQGYLVKAETIKSCSYILERELGQFPSLKVVMCMGDFAIKAVNYIAQRRFKRRAIAAGSTYKIRKLLHELGGIRYMPSYTQTGEAFDIEKTKRKMVVEDIRTAMSVVQRWSGIPP